VIADGHRRDSAAEKDSFVADDLIEDVDGRALVLRHVRQRLESLRRAGVTEWPRPGFRRIQTREVAPADDEPAPAPPAVTADIPTAAPVTPPPPRPAIPSAPPAPSPLSTGSLFEESGFDTPTVSPEERPAVLAAAAAEVARCTRCPHLAETRTQTVFGCGTPTARLMFIGEAPGADEDRLGEPFVGRAGQLLTDMITKGMGLRREDVYIANILKCRPPGNRTPTAEEAANCSGYLEHQIAVIRPEFLCLLGKTAAIGVLGVDPSTTMTRLRGRWHRHGGIRTLVTFHPSYLLRNPAAKKDAWDDLQLLMQEMGLPMPGRKKSAGD
jgi:DNA polymerase